MVKTYITHKQSDTYLETDTSPISRKLLQYNVCQQKSVLKLLKILFICKL